MDGEVMEYKKSGNVLLSIIIVIIITILAAILSAASLMMFAQTENARDNLSAKEIASKIVKDMNYENLSEISEESISKYYEIPENSVSDSAMYVSLRSDSYSEIACFKLKSEEKEDEVSEVIYKYIEAKKNTYKDVNEKAYSIVSKSKIKISYPYIFVAITSDSDAAVSSFENLLRTNDKFEEIE